jgi:hypothetical protein
MMLFHQLERAIHKAQMREVLSSASNWSSFAFDLTTWEAIQEEEGEFSWQGEMYDIVSVKTQGTQILVDAYPDVKESGIVRLMKRWSPENQQDQDLSLTLLKWSMATFIPAESADLFIPAQTTSKSFGHGEMEQWTDVFQKVLSPPPLMG